MIRVMKIWNYNIVLNPEPEGGFTVIVPSLPGCVTFGENLAEARKMARDAIRGYIVSLKKHGDPIPSDEGSFITSIQINQPARSGSTVHV